MPRRIRFIASDSTTGDVRMRLKNLGDKGLLSLYESLRRRTSTANGAGLRSRVIGQNIKDYAEKLRAEMERREIQFTPIEWHTPPGQEPFTRGETWLRAPPRPARS